MALHKGLQNDWWDFCDRCGFPHLVGQLILQRGLKLCTCHNCTDDLTNDYRPRMIAEVLSDGREGVRDPTYQNEAGYDEEMTF